MYVHVRACIMYVRMYVRACLLCISTWVYCMYVNEPYSSKFSRSNNFVIFVRCKLITKFLSMKNFAPMGVSIGAAMNHEKCCSVRSCAG